MTLDLGQHLQSYGIRQFHSEGYWEWMSGELGRDLVRQFDRLRKPLNKRKTTPEQKRAFYDFIADPRVAGPAHSMKGDAIRASGAAVAARLDGASSVLDLGCSVGFLTTYYARLDASRQVLGWDLSERSIEVARELAAGRGVANAGFEAGDIETSHPAGPFDVVVSTQTLSNVGRRKAAVEQVASCMSPDGRLICVEAFPKIKDAEGFLSEARGAGFSLAEFGFVPYLDHGEPGSYPAFAFTRGGESIEVDIAGRYQAQVEFNHHLVRSMYGS